MYGTHLGRGLKRHEAMNMATNPGGSKQAAACGQWLLERATGGAMVVVPEIADYEVRRELLRARRSAGIDRLEHSSPKSSIWRSPHRHAPSRTVLGRGASTGPPHRSRSRPRRRRHPSRTGCDAGPRRGDRGDHERKTPVSFRDGRVSGPTSVESGEFDRAMGRAIRTVAGVGTRSMTRCAVAEEPDSLAAAATGATEVSSPRALSCAPAGSPTAVCATRGFPRAA